MTSLDSLWRRWKARGALPRGSCPACGHDWREHPGYGFDIPLEDGCSECRYEIEHRERAPEEGICHRLAPTQ